MNRSEIVGAAREFIGVPWRRHGRNKHGLDCGGLVFAIAERLGVPVGDLPVADRGWPDGFLLRHFARYGTERSAGDLLAPGALAIFMDAGKARHTGIIAGSAGEWSLVHANARVRRVVEERLSQEWRARLLTAFDFQRVNT